ncbi:histidine kinase dimerization/phosphoacceptor domain -containing protein [Sphingomonas sp.]|uniref:sensor histidine kinase n=1 Tax=Sphingomonas sp. TaxID=28214 RepID=UPI001B12230B|nr:histidine kinase dimerization/phosphoacceptor domain -containing protein [Sphingomonas sp.]MBO9714174.1 ATP-binding protein [Sphingomonas sp.]
MSGAPSASDASWVERLPIVPRNPWVGPAATLAMLFLAFWLRVLLLPVMPRGSMGFVTFFPAILLVTFLLGVRLGVIAALGSVAIGWAFFLTDPMRPGLLLPGLPAVVPFVILVSLTLLIFHRIQRANAKLLVERERSQALAATREALFHELQHRVSNNLQVAAGLLALQKKHLADEAARAAIDEAAQRLGVIGRISRQLYASDGEPKGMRDFLVPLCADVIQMSGARSVALIVEGDETLRLPPDAALPVALIVAESIANAIEHGFAGKDGGSITVTLAHAADGALGIDVADDGSGPPAGFELAVHAGLGLGIARTLAGQLGGRFELVRGEAQTIARLTLPT